MCKSDPVLQITEDPAIKTGLILGLQTSDSRLPTSDSGLLLVQQTS